MMRRPRRSTLFPYTTLFRSVRKAEPDMELPVAVRRTGIAPRRVVAADLGPAVLAEARQLLGEVEGTVGVIATQATRNEVASWLADVADPRLQVVTSLEAKGMEYDAVLVVEPSAILDESPAGRRTPLVAPSPAPPPPTPRGTGDPGAPPRTHPPSRCSRGRGREAHRAGKARAERSP